jgi:60 kDa SS-A/Ro ribonucleoprotein
MALKDLFASLTSRPPRVDGVNHAGGPAYAYGPKALLAQIAATGTLADNFYTGAQAQLEDALNAARAVDAEFVAKAAIHARQTGAMKDMPALLTAWLTLADPELAVLAFRRTIDNGRMLRTFVQIMRSGQVGRSSLGTRPKRLVREWLERASLRDLMAAATGSDPSLADIVRIVHPAPVSAERRAFYGWLIGKPYDLAALPAEIAAFEAWKRAPQGELPPVPFQWLTTFPLSAEQWGDLADRMGWQALRMNLNTLGRHGALALPDVADRVCARLADAEALAKVKPAPYQVMMALDQLGPDVPAAVRQALEIALEISVSRVPKPTGRIVICPDVSGSMRSALTGARKGASTKVRCVDVAAMMTAALMRGNREAVVLPFEQGVVDPRLSPWAPVSVNAAKLASIGGGGTNVSAPLARLNAEKARVDLVVIVSDNQSWFDPARHGATATFAEWSKLKARNRHARLICVDLQPYGSTQARDGPDIMNVGGFNDTVFDAIRRFARNEARDWVEIVEKVEL